MEEKKDMVTIDEKVNCEDLEVLFTRSARLMHRRHHHCERTHPAQGMVLSILKDQESMTQKELMDRLVLRSGSLSELLAKLEQQGSITRIRDEQDKRGFVVMITEKGKSIVSKHEKHHQEKTENLFSLLSDVERRQLYDILLKLSSAWENDSHDRCSGHHGRGREDDLRVGQGMGRCGGHHGRGREDDLRVGQGMGRCGGHHGRGRGGGEDLETDENLRGCGRQRGNAQGNHDHNGHGRQGACGQGCSHHGDEKA